MESLMQYLCQLGATQPLTSTQTWHVFCLARTMPASQPAKTMPTFMPGGAQQESCQFLHSLRSLPRPGRGCAANYSFVVPSQTCKRLKNNKKAHNYPLLHTLYHTTKSLISLPNLHRTKKAYNVTKINKKLLDFCRILCQTICHNG